MVSVNHEFSFGNPPEACNRLYSMVHLYYMVDSGRAYGCLTEEASVKESRGQPKTGALKQAIR